MAIQWNLFVTPGLGDNSYVLYSEDEAVLIDPQRDVWRFLEFAAARKLRIRYVLETHLHNDYISGALEVRNATRASIAAPAKGNYSFDHLRVAEGDEIQVGTGRVVCIETPGHTHEHIGWLVYDNSEDPIALFSGGSLLVGGAGRTDLAGESSKLELTRQQYQTIQRLNRYPANMIVLPTHGAGSFCASSGKSEERFTSIAIERGQNDLLRLNEEDFLRKHLWNLPAYPAYYKYMAPINRTGPPLLKSLPELAALSSDEVDRSHAWKIDMRNRIDFAEAHIAGSLNIELQESFGTYGGWIIPFNEPLILISDCASGEKLAEATTQLIRIGYDRIQGYLNGGLSAWVDSGREVQSYPTGSIEDLCKDHRSGKLRLIDVRQKTEWDAGHAKRSVHSFVGNLLRLRPVLEEGRWSVACASGYRAAMGASILASQGVQVRLIDKGGVADFLENCPDAKES